jgi:multidrug efflux pump subunit AcrA (membrane-fusion protein)
MFVNTDKVYAEFNVIEKDVHKVTIGQKTDVFSDAYPTRTFSGTIDRLAPIIEGRSRTEMAKVELDNKEGLLKAGMFVRALIYTYEKKDALVIPSSAMKKKEQDFFVYFIHKDEAKEETAEAKPQDKKKKGLFAFLKKKEAPKEEPKPAPEEQETETGTIEIRTIKPGYTTQDLIEVDEGLHEGELIVTEVQEDFKDKAKVEITEVMEGLV